LVAGFEGAKCLAIKYISEMNLTGKKLTVVSITRTSLFDAEYVGCCDNCGKVIVNIATVKDEAGKTFEIGLACKKTLIYKLLD
jgi:hypothetical protein